MTKSDILTRIRLLASQRGGHVGLRSFLKATGIPEKKVLGVHWATWNEALAEAGIALKSFVRPRVDETAALEAFAQLIERLQRWPTENQLRLARTADPAFPSLKVFRRLKKEGDFLAKLAAHCATRPYLSVAARMATMRSDARSLSTPVGRIAIKGYVYMMRSGRRYKIGHTSSPSRRHREVRLDLPDPTTLVHSIETDDPAGIEAYWHRRFQAQRIRDTEFFILTAADVAAFRSHRSQ